MPSLFSDDTRSCCVEYQKLLDYTQDLRDKENNEKSQKLSKQNRDIRLLKDMIDAIKEEYQLNDYEVDQLLTARFGKRPYEVDNPKYE